MNVLSLFDGMSCGRVALERAGVKVDNYFASEIDKHAIQVSKNNWSDIVQLGDVLDWRSWDIDWAKIDLLVGGFPCQSFSFAGSGKGFDDERGKLAITTMNILSHVKEKNPNLLFLFENVRMKKQYSDQLDKMFGVNHITINSSLVSAQNRVRSYWTNIPNTGQPYDKEIYLKDILEDLPDCPIGIKVREKSNCLRVGGRNSPFGSKQIWDSPFQRVSKKGKVKPSIDKSACLTGGAHSGGNHSDMDIIHTPFATRRYSVIECERLQTLPDNYTKGVSNSQRYKMLGNGWTVDVIAHFFKNI